jgi:hypothetical protein
MLELRLLVASSVERPQLEKRRGRLLKYRLPA